MKWDLVILAPAKINWFLHIHSKRTDGYHNITSLIQAITLFDEIYLKKDEKISVETEPIMIDMENNLVYKAIKNLQKETGINYGVRIRIKKNIPIMAGLGGGSSDAMLTLKGLNILWNLNMEDNLISRIAIATGSDVASFLNPPVIISGKGEVVRPVNIEKRWTILLIKPEFGISSGWAYDEFDRLSIRYDTDEDIDNIIKLINIGDFSELMKISRNNLEIPVFNNYPLLKEISNRLIDEGALFSRMSGSGSVIYGVFHERDEAIKASEKFSKSGLWTMVVDTITSQYHNLLSL